MFTRTNLNLLTAVLTVFMLILSGSAYAEDEQTQDGSVVAEVNGTVISRQALDSAVAKYLPRTSFHATVDKEKIRQAEKKALVDLVDNELLYQSAEKQGVKVSDAEISEQVDKIKERYGTEKKFKQALEKSRVDLKALEQWIKRDIMIKKYLLSETSVELTDSDTSEYYDNNTEKFMEPEKIRVSYIYVKFTPEEQGFREKAREKAEKVLSMVKSGEDFALAAEKHSDHNSRDKGGDLGYFHRGTLEPQIEKAAMSLEKGEVSGLIENIMGFHIIRLEDIKPPKQVPYEEIKDKLKKELTVVRSREKREALIKRLREDAVIKYY